MTRDKSIMKDNSAQENLTVWYEVAFFFVSNDILSDVKHSQGGTISVLGGRGTPVSDHVQQYNEHKT